MVETKPLDLEQFFFTRNEIAQKHNNRLELQAMTRVREYMLSEANNQDSKSKKAATKASKATQKADEVAETK